MVCVCVCVDTLCTSEAGDITKSMALSPQKLPTLFKNRITKKKQMKVDLATKPNHPSPISQTIPSPV